MVKHVGAANVHDRCFELDHLVFIEHSNRVQKEVMHTMVELPENPMDSNRYLWLTWILKSPLFFLFFRFCPESPDSNTAPIQW